MSDTERELRKLMNKYDERYKKLESERQETKRDGDFNALESVECLQRQCRIMRAELYHAMKTLGILDSDEIEYGGIKDKDLT